MCARCLACVRAVLHSRVCFGDGSHIAQGDLQLLILFLFPHAGVRLAPVHCLRFTVLSALTCSVISAEVELGGLGKKGH